MIRKQFCAVVDIDLPLFDAHKRNGNLPFDPAKAEATDGQRRRWARFTVHEAARWIAAQHLAAQGVTWSEAAAVLRESRNATHCGALGIGANAFEAPGYHVARVEFLTEGGHESDMVARFGLYAGPLDAIARAVAERVEGINARQHFASGRIVNTSLIATNLSHAYHITRGRMRQLGIDGARDYRIDGGDR